MPAGHRMKWMVFYIYIGMAHTMMVKEIIEKPVE